MFTTTGEKDRWPPPKKHPAASASTITKTGRAIGMAFIRKRGDSYYLVHNVRQEGRVRQLHLACLGRRPRINDDVVRGVASKHPFLRVDWKELRHKVSRNLVQPFERDSRYLGDLLVAIRNLHFDLADLPLPLLDLTNDRELSAHLIAGLKLLRATLDVKLHELRKMKITSFAT